MKHSIQILYTFLVLFFAFQPVTFGYHFSPVSGNSSFQAKGDYILGIHTRKVKGKFNLGHAWITITNNNTGKTDTYALWPDKNKHTVDNGAATDVRHNLKQDVEEKGFCSRYYCINQADFNRLMNFINKNHNWTPSYNCSNFASDAVSVATGEIINAKSRFFFWKFGFPANIYKRIRNKEKIIKTSYLDPIPHQSPKDSLGSSFVGSVHAGGQQFAYVWSTSQYDDSLRLVDTSDASVIYKARLRTSNGSPVSGVSGLTLASVYAPAYILYQVPGSNFPLLGRIDMDSAFISFIDTLNDDFSSISISGSRELFGVTSDSATVPSTLYRIDTVTGTSHFLKTLGNGDDGEVICFHPINGHLYHFSGSFNPVFEKIDPVSLSVISIPISSGLYGKPLAVTVVAPDQFLLFDDRSQMVAVDTAGTVNSSFSNLSFATQGALMPIQPLDAAYDHISSGDTVFFYDLSTGTASSWSWDLGDGNVSNNQNPYHVYSQPGRYLVSFTLTDAYGNHSTYSDSITSPGYFMTDSLVLSTGWDSINQTVFPFSNTDPFWRLSVAADQVISPRSTYCVAPHANWTSALSGSQWISNSFSGAIDADTGLYVYKRHFYIDELDSSLSLSLHAMGDDTFTIFLNGNQIVQKQKNYINPFAILVTNPSYFRKGMNVLEAHVENTIGPHGLTLSCYLSGYSLLPQVSVDDPFSEFSQLTLFPNPADDFLFFKGLQDSRSYLVSIIDLQGHVLLSVKSSELDIRSLAPGIYILRISSEKGQVFRRFVKL